MKKTISVILSLCLLLSFAFPLFASAEREVRLVAHRGMNELAPENTLPAFELAGQYGYYGLEFDLQLTKDGVWVVCHEDELERLTDGKGLISEKTFEKVRSLSVVSGSNVADYPGLKLPTLEETLEICREYGMKPYIEVKAGKNSDLDGLVAVVDEMGFSENCVIFSNTKSFVSYIKSTYPELTVWYISYFSTEGDIDFAVENGLDGISLDAIFFKEELLEKLGESGLTVSFWTVDTIENAEKFISYGSKDLTTNNLIYADDGSIAALQEGSEATQSLIGRLVAFGKTVVNKIKTIIEMVRRFIAGFIPENKR